MSPPQPRVYLDASALVKLVITEQETDALRRYLGDQALLVSSRIAEVEVRRVADRQDERPARATVEAVLQGISFVELGSSMATSAGLVGPATLRTLDAIHLASALSLADELGALVTYDLRLAAAAREAGLPVIDPP